MPGLLIRIRIRSGFNDFVDPESGSRGRKIVLEEQQPHQNEKNFKLYNILYIVYKPLKKG
jgi:hypothetical protein